MWRHNGRKVKIIKRMSTSVMLVEFVDNSERVELHVDQLKRDGATERFHTPISTPPNSRGVSPEQQSE